MVTQDLVQQLEAHFHQSRLAVRESLDRLEELYPDTPEREEALESYDLAVADCDARYRDLQGAKLELEANKTKALALVEKMKTDLQASEDVYLAVDTAAELLAMAAGTMENAGWQDREAYRIVHEVGPAVEGLVRGGKTAAAFLRSYLKQGGF